MERPIEVYFGSPSREAMCRASTDRMVRFAKNEAEFENTKHYAKRTMDALLAEYRSTCIRADDPRFGELAGMTFPDLAVLLRYQEKLIYSCEKWKPGSDAASAMGVD